MIEGSRNFFTFNVILQKEVKMKKFFKVLIPTFVFVTLLISACTGAIASTDTSSGGSKVNAAPVEFTGVIESIDGNQWTVNGQVITVDPVVIKDGSFKVGDQVKIEANVQADGSVVGTRVESPTIPIAVVTEVSTIPASTDDSISTMEVISTPDLVAPGIVFDNSGNEAFGTVDSFDGTTIVIGGQSFTIANGAEIKGAIAAGNFVKVEFIRNVDGTVSIRQIQLWDPAAVNEDNSTSTGNDDSASHDQNDDNGNDDSGHNQNDDHGNDDSGHDQNDDNGGGNGGGSDD